MSIVEQAREHAAQIQAHTRTALDEIAAHVAANPDDAPLVTEAKKILSDAADDAVATLKASDKPAPAAAAPAAAAPAPSGGGGSGSHRS